MYLKSNVLAIEGMRAAAFIKSSFENVASVFLRWSAAVVDEVDLVHSWNHTLVNTESHAFL